MILDSRIAEDLMKMHGAFSAEGQLLSRSQLDDCHDRFQQRFGPRTLRNLDGTALLETLHRHANRDSLVYWLEFKNDDELPAVFGSIAGGTPLKFGIFARKETGTWVTGSPQEQRELSIDEAVEHARRHRDQLVAGAEILDALPTHASDEEYGHLQKELEAHAPDVQNTAWGHKYFSMLYPGKLDDYHNPDYQRFHLTRLLQIPPPGVGRYVVGGRYVAIADELGIPINHLTEMTNARHGRPYRYWRIGTSDGAGPRNRWELMKDGSCVALGWPALGDLSELTYNRESKEEVKSRLEAAYPNTAQEIRRNTQQIFNFVAYIQERDVVLACEDSTVLGIGSIEGPYQYEPSSDFPHRRPVKWLRLDEWQLPVDDGPRTTVHQIRKYPRDLVETEERVFEAESGRVPEPPRASTATRRLAGLPGRIQSILDRKGQVILYGPPGTGKTYWAEKTACDLAAFDAFGAGYGQLSDEQRSLIIRGDATRTASVRTCCFHPAYGYEDFIEGYRPEVKGAQMVFAMQDGVFKRLCSDADRDRDSNYYLIIDEINRGDIPRIFGELLTVLEKDKRGKEVILPLSGGQFKIPSNVCVIGTMNTADRSIALLDTALRRRFGFIELMPDYSLLKNATVEGIPLGPWLESLNRRICEHIGRDARNLQIGHSFLLEKERPIAQFERLSRVIREDIIPLLEEYCYEDYSSLEKILGKGLVDAASQRIRHEFFDASRQEELIDALQAPCPELATALQAMTPEGENLDEEGDEGEDDAAGEQLS